MIETFETAFKTIFRELQKGMDTSFVGIVTYFDGFNKVSVQPAIKFQQVGGEEQNFPVLEDVVLIFPGGGGFKISWPISVGDEVLVICAQNDISNWKTTGGNVSPASLRRFSKMDAIAIPGLESFNSPDSVGDSFKITGPSEGTFEMKDDGTVLINSHLEVTK